MWVQPGTFYLCVLVEQLKVSLISRSNLTLFLAQLMNSLGSSFSKDLLIHRPSSMIPVPIINFSNI
jgi:hypothetical protein